MSNYLKLKLSNFKIISIYYIVISLLTMYATYKNGIIIYQKHLIGFFEIFKPLILVIISISIPYLINYIYHKYILKEKYSYKEDYTPIFMALITLSLPLNINILLFTVLVILFSVIKLL